MEKCEAKLKMEKINFNKKLKNNFLKKKAGKEV